MSNLKLPVLQVYYTETMKVWVLRDWGCSVQLMPETSYNKIIIKLDLYCSAFEKMTLNFDGQQNMRRT